MSVFLFLPSSYSVSVGIVDKLSLCIANAQGPVDNPEVAFFLMSTLLLLTSLCSLLISSRWENHHFLPPFFCFFFFFCPPLLGRNFPSPWILPKSQIRSWLSNWWVILALPRRDSPKRGFNVRWINPVAEGVSTHIPNPTEREREKVEPLLIFLLLSLCRTLLPLLLKAFSSCKTAAPFAHKHHPSPSLPWCILFFVQSTFPSLFDGHSQSVHVVLVGKERKISSGSFPNVQFTGIFIHISWTFSNRDERSEVMVNRAAFSPSHQKVKEDIEYIYIYAAGSFAHSHSIAAPSATEIAINGSWDVI